MKKTKLHLVDAAGVLYELLEILPTAVRERVDATVTWPVDSCEEVEIDLVVDQAELAECHKAVYAALRPTSESDHVLILSQTGDRSECGIAAFLRAALDAEAVD